MQRTDPMGNVGVLGLKGREDETHTQIQLEASGLLLKANIPMLPVNLLQCYLYLKLSMHESCVP